MDEKTLTTYLDARGSTASRLAISKPDAFASLAGHWENRLMFRKAVANLHLDYSSSHGFTPNEKRYLQEIAEAREDWSKKVKTFDATVAETKTMPRDPAGKELSKEQLAVMRQAQELVRRDEMTFLQLIERAGIGPDQKDADGCSLLAVAAQAGAIKAICTLCKRLAPVNAADCLGNTPLLWACSMGQPQAAKALLHFGADPAACNLSGATALMLALTRNMLPVANLLIEYGASLESEDAYGNRAMHKAVATKNMKVASFLIECGASLTALNKKGQTPLVLARACPVMSELLQKELVEEKNQAFMHSRSRLR